MLPRTGCSIPQQDRSSQVRGTRVLNPDQTHAIRRWIRAELAKDLRISESCLRNWIAQSDVDDNGSPTELSSKEKKELAELRRDKRRLEMEVEILKRAAAYFARENVLPN